MTDRRQYPWVDANGATDVDAFLAAYAEDDNNFWRADIGDIMNVLDELIERLANEDG